MTSDSGTPFGREIAWRDGVVHPGNTGTVRRRPASRARATLATTFAVLGLVATTASAAIVGGGGSPKVDCLTVFDAPTSEARPSPRLVRCTDGAACDADGLVNGRCELPIAVCTNSTAVARCASPGVAAVTVAHSVDDGDPGFDPEMQALATRLGFVLEFPETRADRCSAPTSVRVSVVGPFANGRCKKGTKAIRTTALSTPLNGRVRADTDHVKLVCDPSPIGCDPRTFFTSTFDRIQTQIFDQSCAVGGCHDSQSIQGELLLERGAAYGNLVGTAPANPDAAAAGWLRVTQIDATSGDAASSYLVHKITGDLGPGLGKRMPFNRPKLDATLVAVIRRWVEAGAPADGWVAGTD